MGFSDADFIRDLYFQEWLGLPHNGAALLHFADLWRWLIGELELQLAQE